jgi:7-carboxy-7-deazaguanine synthase
MLLVNEIYRSILGESRQAGVPCVLVRLTGCHRRCLYCDTAYAFDEGRRMTVEQVLTAVAALGSRTVLVTGGEPLLQDDVLPLLDHLLAAGRDVILETSGTRGAIPLARLPIPVRKIVDVKTPGSGIDPDAIDWEGIAGLGPRDELKFVCCHRQDYEWSRDQVQETGRLPAGVEIIFTAAAGCLEPRELAEWILADGLEVRLQIQLHKRLWPERARGV